MRADSLPLDPPGITVLNIQASRGIAIDAEFMAMVTGRDVRVAAGLDIGIHANRSGGSHAQTRCLRREQIEFGRRLDVKEENARFKRLADFFLRFSHAGENDSIAWHANAPQAV
jgi:hypothetical protein